MWVSEVIDHGFIHSIYAFDPNNIPIEFSAPVARVDIRERPQMLDPQPTRTAQEGSEPLPDHRPEPLSDSSATDHAVYPGEGKMFADAYIAKEPMP
jgi:hypothetical protein